MIPNKKKEIQEKTQEAFSHLNKKKTPQIVQNQTGDIINNIMHTCEEIDSCDEILKLKTEIKHLKKIIDSKDEIIASKDEIIASKDDYIKLLKKK